MDWTRTLHVYGAVVLAVNFNEVIQTIVFAQFVVFFKKSWSIPLHRAPCILLITARGGIRTIRYSGAAENGVTNVLDLSSLPLWLLRRRMGASTS
jgi:hypothetical protein